MLFTSFVLTSICMPVWNSNIYGDRCFICVRYILRKKNVGCQNLLQVKYCMNKVMLLENLACLQNILLEFPIENKSFKTHIAVYLNHKCILNISYVTLSTIVNLCLWFRFVCLLSFDSITLVNIQGLPCNLYILLIFTVE